MSRIAASSPGRLGAAALVVATLALGAGGCGGSDDDDDTVAQTATAATETETTATTETETTPTDTTETEIETEAETEGDDGGGTVTETSPEDQPGGAGDEVPARTLAQFTVSGGRIAPRLIRVPPFISVRVELRSADGRQYGLDFGGKVIAVRDGLSSVSTTFDGLRPGQVLVGTPTGAGNRVRIAATAEPGP